MDNGTLIADIARLLPPGSGSADPLELEPCGGGGNNRVYAVRTGGRTLIAKRYFSHPSDTRDRLGAEYAFLDYAMRAGIDCVPRPVACDRERHLALYEHVAGRRFTAQDATADAVDQAIEFLVDLNRAERVVLAQSLPEASEAAFTIARHVALVDGRVARLKAIAGETEVDRAAANYVETLERAWAGVRARILRRLDALGESPEQPVAQRCVSPSDFGFHNALIGDDGRIRFLDFEYAGWDDPAKTAGDFFCQPAIPVPMTFHERFLERALRFSVHAEAIAARARLLLPAFQIKWCCIMLNVFVPDAARRRRFADPAVDPVAHKRVQLAKAQHLLDSIVS